MLDELQAKFPFNFRDGGVLLIQADCMDVMAELEDGVFCLSCVDPPYGIGCGKTINIPNKKRGFQGNKLHDAKTWDSDIPEKEYFQELRRISENQIIWGGNYFTDYLKPVKAWIFWDKKDTKNQGSKFSDGEMAWTSFNKVTRLFQYGWIGIDYCNKKEVKSHPTQKPRQLYRWLYKNYAAPGQSIIDTHLGSGSSAIEAHYFGVDFVGVELDPDYFAASVERYKKETAQLSLF